MATDTAKVGFFHSLKTQLIVGSTLLLGVTLGSISYFLVVHEKRMLTSEIEKTLVLQGRNIALSSEKTLLRDDPEFELFPRVKRILSSSKNITTLVITDDEHVIVGDSELKNLSRQAEFDLSGHTVVQSPLLTRGEQLLQNRTEYFLRTPVESLDKVLGYVYLRYSKRELQASIRDAIKIIVIGSTLAFGLGIVISLLLFKRISGPMDTLLKGVHQLGKGHLNTKVYLNTKNEFRILSNSFNEMARRMASAQKQLIVKERMDRELEIAHNIQSTLIPKEICQPEGYEIGIYFNSATEVGGDYVDVIPTDSRNVALVMADVSGKGVPGLVVTAMLKIMVHDLAAKGLPPMEVIRRLNISLRSNLKSNMFVTMFFAHLDVEKHELLYSNAGHNPILIYDHAEGSCDFVRMKGPPLGVFPDEQFRSALDNYRAVLRPNDLILQYTDGLSESTNHAGAQLNLDEIKRVSEKYVKHGARVLVRHLAKFESEFRGDAPQTDDITLLSLSTKVSKPADEVSVSPGEASEAREARAASRASDVYSS